MSQPGPRSAGGSWGEDRGHEPSIRWPAAGRGVEAMWTTVLALMEVLAVLDIVPVLAVLSILPSIASIASIACIGSIANY